MGRLGDALDRAESYLGRFAAHLADIDREIRADSSLAELGRFNDLRQGGYRVTTDEARGGRDQRRRDAEFAGGVRCAVFPLAEWLRRVFLGR